MAEEQQHQQVETIAFEPKIDGNKKRKIQELSIPQLHVTYHPLSLRNTRKKMAKNTILLSDLLENTLKDWRQYRCIAIDGMNGTGKTTLCHSLERLYVKINEFSPETTHGSQYNYNPILGFEYLMLPRQIVAKNIPIVWDRCEWSNIIFYLVHALMSFYRHGKNMAETPRETTNGLLNSFAQDLNLLRSITYFEQFYRRDNAAMARLFLVCSNLDMIRHCMTDRSVADNNSFNANDLFNASFVNYQVAQLRVYEYMAKILPNTICIDICDYVNDNFSLGDLQYVLKNAIDVPVNSTKRIRQEIEDSGLTVPKFILSREQPQCSEKNDSNEKCKCLRCALDAATKLHKFIDVDKDHVIYNYSCK